MHFNAGYATFSAPIMNLNKSEKCYSNETDQHGDIANYLKIFIMKYMTNRNINKQTGIQINESKFE